jgi:hypothetical protein
MSRRKPGRELLPTSQIILRAQPSWAMGSNPPKCPPRSFAAGLCHYPMSRPAALRPCSRYPECPPRSSAAGLCHYPMSRPAALRPCSYSTIIIPGPDLQDWTALAPGPRHCMLRVAQLPRLACAACVRARSSLRPCGASLRRKHDQPIRFSGSSEPWESSLGRRLIIRQCLGERPAAAL